MGGGGSKAVQKGAARAAAAAPKPPPSAAAATGGAVDAGVSAAERQREAKVRQRQAAAASLPAEQLQENEGLVRSMNKAMAGMRQYQYELYRNPEVDKRYALRRKSKEEKEAELVGRVDLKVAKQLLEDHARSVERGMPLSAAELARRYGASEEVLEQVLQQISLPIVEQAEPGGKRVGRWPGRRDGGGEEETSR